MNKQAQFYKTETIEKLAKLGYWEWNPKDNKFYISNGINYLLNLNKPIDSLDAMLYYVQSNSVKNGYRILLNYFSKIKHGENPKPIVIGVYDKLEKIKYIEVTASINQVNHQKETYLSGIVQDVTESTKYTILKEKESKFERKIADVAARFVSFKNFNESLIYTLEEIGKISKSSKVILYKIDNYKINNYLDWCSPAVNANTDFVDLIPDNELKLILDLIKDKQTIHFQDISSIPPYAKTIRQLMQERNVESLLISTIQREKQTVGALLLLKYHKEEKWDFADIHMVKMTCLIISNALRQYRVHTQLQESEHRLQLALQAGRLGTWEHIVKTNAFSFDEKYANMFGYTHITINRLNNWFKQNIHPDDLEDYIQAYEKCMVGSMGFYELEYRVKCNNTQYKWVNDWGIVTQSDADGQALEIIGITQDISKRKNAELALIKAKNKAEENDKLKTAFLANMSHEIRTPMNGINGFAELLYNDREHLDNKRNRYLEIIYQSSNKLLKLVNNIMDIAKLETNQIKLYPKPFYLKDMFDELEINFQHLLNGNAKTSLRVVHPDTGNKQSIVSDDSRISQILVFLVENAIKFSDNGLVEIGYNFNPEDQLEFFVKDSGPGITTKKDIFEHFLQSEQVQDKNLGGTGLGLAIAKGLVHLMGGKIWFTTQLQVGTTFYFTIDCKPVNAE